MAEAEVHMQEYFVKLLGRYHNFIELDVNGSTPHTEPHSNGARSAENEGNMIRSATLPRLEHKGEMSEPQVQESCRAHD